MCVEVKDAEVSANREETAFATVGRKSGHHLHISVHCVQLVSVKNSSKTVSKGEVHGQERCIRGHVPFSVEMNCFPFKMMVNFHSGM